MIDWVCACWGSKLKEAHGKKIEFWVISGVFIVPVRCAEVK